MPGSEECVWQQDADDLESWFTDCGESFFLEEEPPRALGMRFCPFCGKPLAEDLVSEDENADDSDPPRYPAH